MVRETIDQFNTLQRFDTRIHEIETLLAKIPEMLKESHSQFETLLKEKNSAEAEFDRSKTELLQLESVAAEQKNLLASAQKKLTSVHNNKEYEAALKELDSLKKSIAEGEAKIKILSTNMAETEETIKSKTTESAEKESDYLAEKEQKESENSSLFEELAKLKAKRDEFAATVKKSSLAKYERIRIARKNLAIVAVKDEACMGCNMKLPPQLAVEVKREKDLYTCPYCQRYLYNEKEAEVVA
ncbi:MAG: C4-type zinc ribbon domain-containing protein [Deferribacteraceae bacterium]|jgi:predicted  nucleic acid-binding Zn-ribbon protein|nr:C4-type zinc ribbon domain-containing protein [Deferribacteraceae bacterium]